MGISIREMMKVTQLTRGGRLMDATRAIQRALGFGDQAKAPSAAQDRPQTAGEPVTRFRAANDDSAVVDTPFREITAWEPPVAEPPAVTPTPTTAPAPTPAAAPPLTHPGSFTEHVFQFADESYAYRLYLPPHTDAASLTGLPLVVLLHGCKQDAADFAQGTAMNALAEQERCLVLYPEQLSKANSLRCWNWFDPAHQGRDAGEPGMIAALTRSVMEAHQADPRRVYIAGLSAGGAMSALVASLYPEVFAAVGVHSGLPTGAASNVISAFGAMRRGASGTAGTTPAGDGPGGTPTIVFHGSADKTVHPDNGDQVMDAALAAMTAAGMALQKSQSSDSTAPEAGADDRGMVRTVYRDANGKSWVEHWAVSAGPHAWSGGNAAGSFTDPRGPDASRAMLTFFLQHQRPQPG